MPVYQRYVRERFLRCLDLYLCPRAKRMKLTIDAEYLIPKLPSPKDLQPFPTVESMVYNGHTDIIRCISVEPLGQYIVSGSDDTTVKSKFPSLCGIHFKRLLTDCIYFQYGKFKPVAALKPLKLAILYGRWLGARMQRFR